MFVEYDYILILLAKFKYGLHLIVFCNIIKLMLIIK